MDAHDRHLLRETQAQEVLDDHLVSDPKALPGHGRLAHQELVDSFTVRQAALHDPRSIHLIEPTGREPSEERPLA